MEAAKGAGLTTNAWVEAIVVQLFVTEQEINTVPADKPVTIPVAGFTVAIVVLLLFHTPAADVSESVILAATQRESAPEMAPTDGAIQ